MSAKDIVVKGIVQGVGFRPFVYRLAEEMGLSGYVRNEARGVVIHLEGDETLMKKFIDRLEREKPPRAKIVSVEVNDSLEDGFNHFFIDFSMGEGERQVFISPDIATCDECLKELFDPLNRRYRFPFINCTNCGPRFTITFEIPYDRKNTTMNKFQMCNLCEEEYKDPHSRRFHAQPNCCRDCGPELFVMDKDGKKFEGDPIKLAANFLREGRIILIKGLGGFHIACNAMDGEAVKRIRSKKRRGRKPFALMGTIEMIKSHCYVSKDEEGILKSPSAPIVLLRKREDSIIPDEVAPGMKKLGFMLPYTPIHHLLMQEIDFPIVLTSANFAEEPIIFEDAEIYKLKDIYDYVLTHNRAIYIRADDSVGTAFQGEFYPIRRSRGFVPDPIEIPISSKGVVLGVGGDLKNTFCLVKDNYAIVSQYIGDMENLETEEAFLEALEHFERIYSIKPDIVVSDLHPGYLSTRLAESLRMPHLQIQHHRAHMLSLLLENNFNDKAICFSFDGTGYGEDGNVWGGEVFVGDIFSQDRVYHLEYVPLPGGDAAIINPWMYGVSLLDYAGIDPEAIFPDFPVGFVQMMIENRINTVPTSSMGRLFDGVAAILRVSTESSYEGESAIMLEESIKGQGNVHYELELAEGEIKIIGLIKGIVEDIKRGTDPSEISLKFHNTIVETIRKLSLLLRRRYSINTVGLTGGVFQNMFLMENVYTRLKEEGFNVLWHRRVPTNDGGIALGQAGYGVISGWK